MSGGSTDAQIATLAKGERRNAAILPSLPLRFLMDGICRT